MVKVEFEDGLLYVTCGGARFSEQLETCRDMKMIYSPSKKAWTISPGKYEEVLAEFHQFGVQLSEYDKLQINQYIDNISDFHKIMKRSERRHYDDDVLNSPPKYDFQRVDVNRAINQTSMLFKWDTGTGKSWALAATLEELRKIGEVYKAIILTSSIGIMNLNGELKKFIKNYDESRTLVVASVTDLKKDRAIFSNDDYDIIIMGYDSFRSINDYYDKIVNKREKKVVTDENGKKHTKKVRYRKSSLPLKEWYGDKEGIVFLDECHLSGKHGSQRGDALIMNLKFWKYRYLFSATPNDVEENFYPTLRILDNALVKGLSYQDWLQLYCELGTRFSRYAPNKSTWNWGKWAALQHALGETYVSTREKSLLGLPPAIDMDLIMVEMSPQQRRIYEIFSNITLEIIKKRNQEKNTGVVNELLNTFQVLQMAVDNPESIIGSKVMDTISALNIDTKMKIDFVNALNDFDYLKHFNKIKALENILEYECEEMGNKVIVFYYHPLTMEKLKKIYQNAFILSSDIEESERFKIVEDFKKSSEKVLIASIMIANTSFTLTECKAAIFYERYWSGIIYEQARGRIHRIGQTEETRYYNMCYENCIDNLQLEALKTKGQCIQNIGKMSTLTKDEWRLIFGGTAEELNGFLKKIA